MRVFQGLALRGIPLYTCIEVTLIVISWYWCSSPYIQVTKQFSQVHVVMEPTHVLATRLLYPYCLSFTESTVV